MQTQLNPGGSPHSTLPEVIDCVDIPVIGEAGRHYGFFQEINHGVSGEAVERSSRVAEEFFGLPVEEKMKLYSDDPSKTLKLSTSVNVCYPLDKYSPEWPSIPSSFGLTEVGLKLLPKLLKTQFYDKCVQHGNRYTNFICCDCMSEAICLKYTQTMHKGHKILQVYKASRRVAIKKAVIAKLVDITGIKSFIIHGGDIVFINSCQTKEKQAIKDNLCIIKCETCHWKIESDNRFCSLDCKFGVTLQQLKRFSISPYPLSNNINVASSSVDQEDEDQCQPSTTTIGQQNKKRKQSEPLIGLCSSFSYRKKSRKGIPMRAPLF